MENDMASELGLLTIDNNKDKENDNLVQIMEAVEAATATIKLQVDENNQLRNELYLKTQELQKYKSNESMRNELEPYETHQDNTSLVAPHSNSVNPNNWDPDMQNHQNNPQRSKLNLRHSSEAPPDTITTCTGSPSTSFSPTRCQIKGEYDQRVNLSGHGSMPMTQLKIQQHEEEMMLLRKHLAEYSIKETQVRNEKYVLETRIAHMRQAFDQQQQDLVDAASKAISYRQDIIEENIRLTYALQDAQQERATFISALLPLLTEYSLQPSVPDAQSIVSRVKVLFKHLQEKLIITETKLKESQYQLAPWHSDINPFNFSPYSPAHSIGAAMNEKGLELVHRPTYSSGNVPTSSSDVQTVRDNDISGRQSLAKNMETDDLGRYSPFASRNDVSQAHMQDNAHGTLYGQETAYKQVTFSVPDSSNVTDDRVAEGYQNDRETSINWDSGSSTYITTLNDPNSTRSPYLPPVLEEQSSSFSEAADEDPLPAIEGLQISGEAFPGQELQASGFSINGTTNCNFEWVRHHEDGSVNYIEGAKQPTYIVTADDVNAYLAIEVQPLDNRNRKGELVKVFANEHRKITCDPEMHCQIEKTLSSGQASYKLSLSTGYLDIWEPVTLGIKREGYSIKRAGHSDVIVTEKFLQTTTVSIPYGGQGTEFSIIGSGSVENILRTDGSSTDCSRDMIVLTLRLFILRASDNRKRKKKGLFFSK